MTDYFIAHEVLEKVEGLHSLSTLNKWANFIQKECAYSFHYDYSPFVSYKRTKRTLNHRKTRMFTLEEIKKFQKVVEQMPTLGRDTSLRKQFDNRYHLDAMSHKDLMDELNKQVEGKLQKNHDLINRLSQQYQQLEKQQLALKQRTVQLEEQLASQEQTSSGWFRRKR